MRPQIRIYDFLVAYVIFLIFMGGVWPLLLNLRIVIMAAIN